MMRNLVLVLALLVPVWCLAQETGKDPVVRVDLEEASAVPGQPVVLRVTVLVPTWMPKPPVMPTYDVPNVAVRQDGRRATAISERIDGETWSGISRKYVLFPLVPGRVELPAQDVIIQYANPDTNETVRFETRTEPIALTGEIPKGAEDLDPFLAANSVSIEQSFDKELDELEPGDAVVRTLAVKIKGAAPMAIPPLVESTPTPAVAVYPDEPALKESFDRGVISGSRTERITYVAEAGGTFEAPPVTLEWFNLETGKTETASADGFKLVVRGPPPATAGGGATDWRGLVAAWLPVIATLIVAGLLIQRFWPRVSAWNRARQEAYRASERFAYREAEQALTRHQLGPSLTAARRWWRFWEPGGTDLPDALTRDLIATGAELYGRNAAQGVPDAVWTASRKSLAVARRQLLRAESRRKEAGLPPLNPSASGQNR